jgi:hypothetical protein
MFLLLIVILGLLTFRAFGLTGELAFYVVAVLYLLWRMK